MDSKQIRMIRIGLLVAVALVAVLLIYAYLSTSGVQDASNNESLSAQFDALNPQIPGTNGGNPGSDDTDTDAVTS